MARNEITLQSKEGTHPVDENLRPIQVGGKATSIETAQHGNGARVNGDLEVTGDIKGNIKDVELDLTKINSTDLTIDDAGTITLDAHTYAESEGVQFYLAGTQVGDITGHHAATNLRLYENIGASTDDFFNIATAASGATIIGTTDAGGAAGHIQFQADGYVSFENAVGFVKYPETFSDDSIIGSGGTDDTHIDFRISNKLSLAVTGNITNLNLIFPAVSGNFLLLLTYDGDHTITNYKVYEADESAADGDADVFWAGGTKPDNTASGVDILSFFYDATAGADKCYGVASLAFATP